MVWYGKGKREVNARTVNHDFRPLKLIRDAYSIPSAIHCLPLASPFFEQLSWTSVHVFSLFVTFPLSL